MQAADGHSIAESISIATLNDELTLGILAYAEQQWGYRFGMFCT